MFTTCLIPVCSILGLVIDIFISIRIRKQAINRNPDGSIKRDGNFQKQMLFLMLASICVFLITTLPLAIYRIISPRQTLIIESIVNAVNNLTILTWLQSLNYSVSYLFLDNDLFRYKILFFYRLTFIQTVLLRNCFVDSS